MKKSYRIRYYKVFCEIKTKLESTIIKRINTCLSLLKYYFCSAFSYFEEIWENYPVRIFGSCVHLVFENSRPWALITLSIWVTRVRRSWKSRRYARLRSKDKSLTTKRFPTNPRRNWNCITYGDFASFPTRQSQQSMKIGNHTLPKGRVWHPTHFCRRIF